MDDKFVCECSNEDTLEIPHEYDSEVLALMTSSRWPKQAYIILKTCPTYPSVQDKILDTTKHLALIAKAH